MAAKQKQALTDKLTSIGYPTFEAQPGQEDVLMLYVDGRLIGGVDYALSLSDEQLKALIDETVAVPGD